MTENLINECKKMFSGLENTITTNIKTSDGEDFVLFSVEPLLPDEIEVLQLFTRDELTRIFKNVFIFNEHQLRN